MKKLDGITVLREVLKRLRWDSQDGYPNVGSDGKFSGNASFITCGLPQDVWRKGDEPEAVLRAWEEFCERIERPVQEQR